MCWHRVLYAGSLQYQVHEQKNKYVSVVKNTIYIGTMLNIPGTSLERLYNVACIIIR